MNRELKLETRFPTDIYAFIPKVLMVLVLVFAFSEDWVLAFAVGVPVGILLHVIPHAYDCKVILQGTRIKFYFFRPWFWKEFHDLKDVDLVVIESEIPDNTLKDIWWKSDMLWPLNSSKLLLYKNQCLVYTLNFRTNTEDAKELEEILNRTLPSAKNVVNP